LTTSGSTFGRGRPVADDEFASLIISAAGKRARDAIVCEEDDPGVTGKGDDAAEGPLDDNAGVLGEFSVAMIFFA
jgi:hypothetical protein